MDNTPNLTLLLIQSGCFCTTLVLALVLLMSRFHLQSLSRGYETSRWLLFSALALYAVHYLLQMTFGFRAQGEDVGTLVNILFYLPAAVLMSSATLRTSTSMRYLKRFMAVGIGGIIVTFALFVVGLCIFHSLHMAWVLHVIEVIYVVMIAFFIFNPGVELRRMYRKIEDETADDNSKFHLYMRSGTILLYAMGFIGAMSIFSTRMVLAVAAFFLLALIFYVVSFVSVGFSMQALSSIVDEVDAEENTSLRSAADSKVESQNTVLPSAATAPVASTRLTEAQTAHIQSSIAAWHAKQGYSTSNLTSITMAQRLGIPKRQLTQYLAEHEGSTFRVWLSNIRIEEAKRMLLTEQDYSIESIAEACGFSSRSWMMEKFKASTGMTPSEWRDTQKED